MLIDYVQIGRQKRRTYIVYGIARSQLHFEQGSE